jgi:NADPH:quinone reductase-like Zn-dependent oxidoreductase
MPETHKVLRRDGAKKEGGTYLKFHNELIPTHGPSEVLIRVRAVSLNWKDVAMIDGRLPWPCLKDGIVGTEFAGEVQATGEKIRLFKVAVSYCSSFSGPEYIAHDL